ncbi:MAG TPA: long-chain fatty acid--CoA ligase [Myxococcales bacterium]
MIAKTNLGNAPVAGPTQARTLIDWLLWHGSASATRMAAKQKVAGSWREITWAEMVARVRKVSDGLVKLGVRPGDRVCIYANTSYDWCVADFAIAGAQAVTVPIYASNTPEETAYIINNSESKVVFYDHDKPDGKSQGRWTRLQAIADKIPAVERFISFEQASEVPAKRIGMGELEAMGAEAAKANPKAFEERVAQLKGDDLNVILYTSGTTGVPKGVMLTHGAWLYQSEAIEDVGVLAATDVMLLFLPLAHSFARVFQQTWLRLGFAIAFAEAVEKAVDNAAEVQATVMPAVPRVFEKAYSKVTSDGGAAPGIKGRLFHWAMGQFEEYANARSAGREYSSAQWSLAKRLVFAKIAAKLKDRFGGHMKVFVSGGAPLSRKIAYFFEQAGLLILEGYGLTETSAPTHVNRIEKVKLGTVGPAFKGTECRIAEDGEILLRGPQVMKGYYKLPQETAAVLDPDGWFHSGDIGEVDPDGYLKITDRKKDLIKTSGGKYIAPQELENALKTEPLISQVAIIGDRRRFVSALFTVNEENVAKFAAEAKLGNLSYAELCRRPEVRERIQNAVTALNSHLPSYSTIKKFTILDADWTQQTGELTPKMSVKRKVVAEKFKAQIDALYDGQSFD